MFFSFIVCIHWAFQTTVSGSFFPDQVTTRLFKSPVFSAVCLSLVILSSGLFRFYNVLTVLQSACRCRKVLGPDNSILYIFIDFFVELKNIEMTRLEYWTARWICGVACTFHDTRSFLLGWEENFSILSIFKPLWNSERLTNISSDIFSSQYLSFVDIIFCQIKYHYYFTPCEFFYTKISWRSFTVVCLTLSLLRFPELCSECWPISTMLESRSLRFFWFPILPIFLPII